MKRLTLLDRLVMLYIWLCGCRPYWTRGRVTVAGGPIGSGSDTVGGSFDP